MRMFMRATVAGLFALRASRSSQNAIQHDPDNRGQAHRILMPLIEEWETHQRIAADWAGVDLLRA
jgi:hypothetical protein